MEHVTVDLISTKEFSRVSKGYDPREVDEFLDDICDEMERMEAEIRDLRQKNANVRPAQAAAAGPAAAAEPDALFRRRSAAGSSSSGICWRSPHAFRTIFSEMTDSLPSFR